MKEKNIYSRQPNLYESLFLKTFVSQYFGLYLLFGKFAVTLSPLDVCLNNIANKFG